MLDVVLWKMELVQMYVVSVSYMASSSREKQRADAYCRFPLWYRFWKLVPGLGSFLSRKMEQCVSLDRCIPGRWPSVGGCWNMVPCHAQSCCGQDQMHTFVAFAFFFLLEAVHIVWNVQATQIFSYPMQMELGHCWNIRCQKDNSEWE
jgi:hypothetical protein